jgi:CRISPR-associated protein Cmr5
MTGKSKQTLAQRRAAHAWQVIETAKAETENGRPVYVTKNAEQKPGVTERGKKLAGQMKKLPTRIIAAGLGQTLAFLRAKNDAPLVEQALADWLLRARQSNTSPTFERTPDTGKKLLEQLVQRWTAQDLRRQTQEALAYLPWLIRFAEAEGFMEGGD